MFDKNKLPPDALTYFDGLSELVKESISQAGLPFQSRQELETFVANLDR